jgi:hypothetical protein
MPAYILHPGESICAAGHTTFVMMLAVNSEHILYATTGSGTSKMAMASFFDSNTG